MLGKLIKYDLLWSIKLIAIFLGLGVVSTILGLLFELIPNSLLFEIIADICKGASIAMFANALFNSLFRSWVRINLNFYKDGSYLTHTLPISKQTHLASKVISQIILITLTALLLILAIIVMYVDKEVFEYLKTMIEFTSDALNTSVVWLVFIFSIIILLEILFMAFCGNFGIIVGHMFNKKKMLLSFVFGVIPYCILQLTLLISFLILSIFNKDIFNIMFEKSSIMSYGSIMTISYISIILHTIFNIVLYVLTNYFFKKGVNVN